MALLEVQDLKQFFKVSGGTLHAVDGVTFSLDAQKTLGVVGESGCGKTTLGRTILHLIEPTSGKITFDGKDISRPTKSEMRSLREEMQIIFQDPLSSLNPRMSLSEAVMEPLLVRGGMSKADMQKQVRQMMDTVGIASRFEHAYPHELDGGTRQRIGIARALVLRPKFIVCDEPVSALDVSIQAQIINLLLDLQEEFGLAYMFVTHDLSVVKYISNDIMVMYLGQMVEKAPANELFSNTMHPYSKALLSAVPEPTLEGKRKRILLKGELTSPINPKPGCRFAPRCLYATEACRKPQVIEECAPNHFVACCRYKELKDLDGNS